MKQLKMFIASAFLVLFSIAALQLHAQTPANHIYHQVTWVMNSGQDSTMRAERNAVLKEYHEKVTMKNEFILHSWMMTHFFTDDSRDFIVVTEYTDLNGIEKAFARDGELEKQAWPDAKQRADFMKKMASYFSHHKDAIFSSMPSLTK